MPHLLRAPESERQRVVDATTHLGDVGASAAPVIRCACCAGRSVIVWPQGNGTKDWTWESIYVP